jgi:hypothetical protein
LRRWKMPRLKYYGDEETRQIVLHRTRPRHREILIGLAKLCRHYKIKQPLLRWTSGNRFSRAGIDSMTINSNARSWLLLCHELAHTWHRQRHFHRGIGGSYRSHGKDHRRLVDILCGYVLRQEWHVGGLWPRVDTLTPKPVQAPRTSERQHRIDLRRNQIARLERKIKGLTTRLRNARRSLSALERVEAQAARKEGGA